MTELLDDSKPPPEGKRRSRPGRPPNRRQKKKKNETPGHLEVPRSRGKKGGGRRIRKAIYRPREPRLEKKKKEREKANVFSRETLRGKGKRVEFRLDGQRKGNC